jgi:hypothetical protein
MMVSVAFFKLSTYLLLTGLRQLWMEILNRDPAGRPGIKEVTVGNRCAVSCML